MWMASTSIHSMRKDLTLGVTQNPETQTVRNYQTPTTAKCTLLTTVKSYNIRSLTKEWNQKNR